MSKKKDAPTFSYKCPCKSIEPVEAVDIIDAKGKFDCIACQYEGTLCKLGPRLFARRGRPANPTANAKPEQPVLPVPNVQPPLAQIAEALPELPPDVPPIPAQQETDAQIERYIAERKTQDEQPPVSNVNDADDVIRAELIRMANAPVIKPRRYSVAADILARFDTEINAARAAGHSWKAIAALFKANGYTVSPDALYKMLSQIKRRQLGAEITE